MDGNGDGIGEGGGDVKTRKKPHESCRRDQALLIRTHHHLCRQGVSYSGTRQLRSQGLVSVYAHRAEGITGFKGREGGNGVGGAIGVGGGDEDGNGVRGGNGDVNVDGDGDGAGTRRGGWRQKKGREMGTGTGAGTGQGREWGWDRSGAGNESSSRDGNGHEDWDRTEESGGGAKKRDKPHKSRRRDVGNGGDLGGKRKNVDNKGFVQ